MKCIRADCADGPNGKAHTVTMPDKAVRKPVEVTDRWNDVPEDLPLHSAPFRDGVFSRTPGKAWKAAGTAIPVFSLRSGSDFGIGEFNDLRLLADWAALTGQKIIQLLPVNDTTMTGTWEDSYPYNANSSFALHPQFIHLPDAGVEEDEEYRQLQAELNSLPEVDYERVNREKRKFLQRAFEATWDKVSRRKAYKDFIGRNARWLMPYAVFCTLRDLYGTADFSKWKTEEDGADFSVYDEDMARDFAARHRKEVNYHCFVQYHLHTQLSEARDYARSKGIVFKGRPSDRCQQDKCRRMGGQEAFQHGFTGRRPAGRLLRRRAETGDSPPTTGTKCRKTATAGGRTGSGKWLNISTCSG